MVRVNQNSLYAAKKSFMNIEASEKNPEGTRIQCENLYGWRFCDWKQWKTKLQRHGLAKVQSKEGQCVLIRYRGAFYKMSQCHLMKVNSKKKEKKNLEIKRNKEYKNSSNETNEVLDEED